MPAKEPPGQYLCASLEQVSPFLLVQYLVTGRLGPIGASTLSNVGAPLGFTNKYFSYLQHTHTELSVIAF